MTFTNPRSSEYAVNSLFLDRWSPRAFDGTAVAEADPVPAADEVMDWTWADPAKLVESVRLTPWAFSPWLVLQLPLLYPENA